MTYWRTLALSLLISACQSPAITSTARTLPRGGADVALALNLTRVSIAPLEVEGVRVPASGYTYPSFLPELALAFGVADDLELRGRLALSSGLIEAGIKYRFVHLDALHMALAPALGYRALGIVNGPVATLPLLVTYDLEPWLSLSGGPLVLAASYRVPDDLDGREDADLGGDTLYVGGALGIELRAPPFHVMPSIELQRSVARSGEAASLPAIDVVFLTLSVGVGGR